MPRPNLPGFLWAVSSHGAAALSGTLVTLGGVVWWLVQYRWPETKLPAIQPWMVVAVGVMLLFYASYQAWRDERIRAETLETKRPEFAAAYAGLEQSVDTSGKPIPDKFLIRFRFANNSGIAASDFSRRVLTITDLNAPGPLDDNTTTNANQVFENVNFRSGVAIPPNATTHYFAIFMEYRDSRTGHPYQQEFFYWWPGSGPKMFEMHFRDMTIQQKQLIEAYLTSRKLLTRPWGLREQ